ncbi:MAG: GGDEF domain-containing protein [Thiobacillus sp.]|nr:GGDEF domain-containing protein [Thiobacillus sp.]
MKKPWKLSGIKGAPLLVKALTQSEQVKVKVETCAVELSEVNTVLKGELIEHLPLEEIQHALDQSTDVEDKVQECADDLHQVNRNLVKEITARKKLEKRLDAKAVEDEKNRYLAYHDTATGLANRTLFNDRIEQALVQSERHGRKFAVLFIDLDRFKAINDTFGHAMGDKVLQMVATKLQACVRQEDTVSRIGGDEFLCLLIEVNNEADVAHIAEAIIRAISEIEELDETRLKVTASIGISIYPGDGTTAEVLIKNADSSMYRAKQAGERYAFFSRKL